LGFYLFKGGMYMDTVGAKITRMGGSHPTLLDWLVRSAVKTTEVWGFTLAAYHSLILGAIVAPIILAPAVMKKGRSQHDIAARTRVIAVG
jgi:uncharacterized RDD family membrane protein YckC